MIHKFLYLNNSDRSFDAFKERPCHNGLKVHRRRDKLSEGKFGVYMDGLQYRDFKFNDVGRGQTAGLSEKRP